MTTRLRIICMSLMAFFICYSTLMRAQSADREENLFACEDGWSSCDLSVLTEMDKKEIAAAKHRQNISDCESASSSCDRSTLGASDLAEVDVAAHRNVVSNCWNGIGSCDYSKLTTF